MCLVVRFSADRCCAPVSVSGSGLRTQFGASALLLPPFFHIASLIYVSSSFFLLRGLLCALFVLPLSVPSLKRYKLRPPALAHDQSALHHPKSLLTDAYICLTLHPNHHHYCRTDHEEVIYQKHRPVVRPPARGQHRGSSSTTLIAAAAVVALLGVGYLVRSSRMR